MPMTARHAARLGSRHYYEGKKIDANPFDKWGHLSLPHLAAAYRRGYMRSWERGTDNASKGKGNDKIR